MSSGGTVYATSKDEVAFVDLNHSPDLGAEAGTKWRAAVAQDLKCAKVVFASQACCITCQDGNESTQAATAFAADPSWSPAGEFYTPEGLRDLIDSENRNSLNLLVAQMRSPMGVVPFVGAGLSIEFGFPSWPKFLTGAAAFHSSPDKVFAKIAAGDLIDAATLLFEDGPDRFQRLVANAFGGPVSSGQVSSGAAGLLPLIASGPVITTNFDRVLESAFLAADKPFDSIVTGHEPDNIIRAMHRNEHVLIKLHGDASDRSARVFTGLEYDKQYGAISKLARILFTNRPLLFLGASLDKDRTLDVLHALHEELPGLTHYAILSASFSVATVRKRRLELDTYGISPVWFVRDEFTRIQEILQELLQDASTRSIWRTPKSQVVTPSAKTPTVCPDTSVSCPDNEAQLASIVRRLARKIVHGRLAFFLGAAAHLNRDISASDLYGSLAKDYAFDEKASQRAEVAQFIIDTEGKAEAWAVAKSKLQADSAEPSLVYRFLTRLPALLRTAKLDEKQWLLTTNYDTVLERVMTDAGERFHLLYYQVDGPEEGRFIHRDLDGCIRIIERPDNIHAFPGSSHVIVKLDGGITYDPHIPETVAISPMDFSISAGRLPTALPLAVRSVLLERSLLILGSGLRDAHVQRLVRWSAGNRRVMKTWAVKWDVTPSTAEYWSAAGVELVRCDLSLFIQYLEAEVCRLLAG